MSSTLNRAVMTRVIAETHGLSHAEAREILDTMFDSISAHLCEGGSVSFHGFGTLVVKPRDGHVYVDPVTGQRKVAPPRHFVRFSVSRKLQSAVREAQGEVP